MKSLSNYRNNQETIMREQTQRYVEAVMRAHPEFRPPEPEPIIEPEPVEPTPQVAVPATLEQLLAALDEEMKPPPRGMAKIIIKAVAERHGYGVRELMSSSRRGALVRARHEAYYEVRKGTELSLTQIGNIFDRDHSTILYGINKHEARLKGEEWDKTRNNTYEWSK